MMTRGYFVPSQTVFGSIEREKICTTFHYSCFLNHTTNYISFRRLATKEMVIYKTAMLDYWKAINVSINWSWGWLLVITWCWLLRDEKTNQKHLPRDVGIPFHNSIHWFIMFPFSQSTWSYCWEEVNPLVIIPPVVCYSYPNEDNYCNYNSITTIFSMISPYRQ